MGKRTHPIPPRGRAVYKRLIEREMTVNDLADAIGCKRSITGLVINGMRRGEKYWPRIFQVLGLDEQRADEGA